MSLHTEEFIAQREKLRQRIEAHSGPGIVVTVKFTNEDVPRFLKQLDAFERRPVRRGLIVK